MAEVPQVVIWLVSIVLVEAAVIDGRQLRVPNWLTFHFLVGGLAYGFWAGGMSGVFQALLGAGVGLACLLPLYAIGGMGAGDVKLMAGLGAWIGPMATMGAFVSTGLIGGIIAVAMIIASGEWQRHWSTIQVIGHDLMTIRDLRLLSERAGGRKKELTLLPYGIPIAIGSIAYFVWSGMLP